MWQMLEVQATTRNTYTSHCRHRAHTRIEHATAYTVAHDTHSQSIGFIQFFGHRSLSQFSRVCKGFSLQPQPSTPAATLCRRFTRAQHRLSPGL